MAIDKAGKIQRPLMGPRLLEDDGSAAAGGSSRFRAVRVIGRLLWRAVRTFWKVLTYDPLRRKLRIEDGSRLARGIRAFAYRVAFVPVVLAGIVCLIVYGATHPRGGASERHAGSLQVYYDAVTFMTPDGVNLEGVLFPVIDAKQVLVEKEHALRKRYPAVVLVHDMGMRKDQMLPLVRPLHDAGFVVLAMNLRGNGASGAAAQTFGLREALDVKAAVDFLRRRPFVDGSRITLVGAGTGGTAAMIHAQRDPSIAALVIADPVKSVQTLLDGRLAPRHEVLAWLRPMCKWAFEMAFQLDVDDVAWNRFEQVRQTRPVLVVGDEGGRTDFSRPTHIDEIASFLVHQTIEPKIANTGTK